ncbi:MAG TPA: hypothetical protein VNE17_07935 [Nitrolancea sp.]|nr:hypothetical protein [Nitrolancea sp.]
MNELMQQLKERAGLSDEQAEKAVAVFTGFLSQHMSDDQLNSFAKQIPGLGQFADKIPGGLGEKLGGMLGGFGKPKD